MATGTTHHLYCPICANYTVDKTDNECKYADCKEISDIDLELAYYSQFEDTVEKTIFDGTPDYLR